MKVAVLIRVYDRIEDLKYNLRIIAETWKTNNYHVIVVSNGKSNGYLIPDDCLLYIDRLVTLEVNAGHRKGNSQLLMEGAKFIPHDCDFTLILEADTWVFGDKIHCKYINLLSLSPDAVWASADWYDKYFALATDFALIKSDYIRQNPDIFDFELFPECHISNFLRNTNAGYIWITEFMPVHIPSYVRPAYPYVPNIKEKRFYVFPNAMTVTHHTEFLKKGMKQKKRYFNIVSDFDYFCETKVKLKKLHKFNMNFWIFLSKCLPKRSWYSKKIYKALD